MGVVEGKDEVSVSNDDVTTTEAEPMATEESVQTTTILPSEPITTSTTTTTTSTTTPPTTSTTTTEAATTTATDATTFESSSSESSAEIDTEAIFVSSTVAPTEPKTDDSKIHFRDDGVEGLHKEDLCRRWSGGREEEGDLGAKESRGGCFEDLLPLRGGGRCKHTKLGSGILFSSLILIT